MFPAACTVSVLWIRFSSLSSLPETMLSPLQVSLFVSESLAVKPPVCRRNTTLLLVIVPPSPISAPSFAVTFSALLVIVQRSCTLAEFTPPLTEVIAACASVSVNTSAPWMASLSFSSLRRTMSPQSVMVRLS